MSTLDSSKKLTTFKGTTVTKGFLEGTMSLEETVLYLEKLGLTGVFEELLMKGVFVPPGAQARHLQSNKVYETGMFIPVRERTWEDFVNVARGERQEMWEITEGGAGEEFDDPMQTAVEDEEYEAAAKRVAEAYDDQDLGILYRRMMSQIEEIDDEGVKEQAVEELNNFIVEVHSIQEAQLERQKDEVFREAGVSLEHKARVEEIIGTFRQSLDLKVNQKLGNISVKMTGAAKITGSSSVGLHLGAFISAMEVSGNTAVLQRMVGIMQAAIAGQTAPVINIPVSEMFPEGLKTDREKQIYKDMIRNLHSGMSDDNLVLAASQIGHNLSQLYRENRAASTKLTAQSIELLERKADELETNISTLITTLGAAPRGASNTYLISGLNSFQFAKSMRQFHRNLSSGNLTVQTFLDASDSFLGGKHEVVTALLDEHYDFVPIVGSSLSDFVKNNPNDYREQLKNALYGTRLRAKPTRGARGDAMEKISNAVRKAFKTQMSADYMNTEEFKRLVDGGVVSALAKYPSVDADSFANALVGAFSEKIVSDVERGNRKMVRQDALSIVTAAATLYQKTTGNGVDEGMVGEVADEIFDNKQEYSKYVTEKLRERSAARSAGQEPPPIITPPTSSAGSSSPSSISDEAKEGLVSLFMHGIYTSFDNTQSNDSDYDSEFRASAAISYFMGGNIESVDINTGAYIYRGGEGEKLLHLRILGAARFLPRLTVDGYQWAPTAKDYIDRLISAKNPMLSEITDRDRLSFISNMGNTETIKPIFLVLGNVTASLANVTEDETGTSSVMLDRKSYESITSRMDVDLSHTNADRARGINVQTQGILGESLASVDMGERLFSERIDASSPEFSRVNLASFLRFIGKSDDSMLKVKTPEEKSLFTENLKSLIAARTRGKLPDNVVEYYTSQLEDAAVNGSTKGGEVSQGNIGHTYEFLTGLPILANYISADTQVQILTPKPGSKLNYDALEGFAWEDSGGTRHTFGKMAAATSGMMDMVHLRTSRDGKTVNIDGYESKMYEDGDVSPHLGNSTNFQRLVISYAQMNPDAERFVFGDLLTVNAPWKGSKQPASSCSSTDMRLYGGREYIASGVCPDSGDMVFGDYKVPTL